MLKSYFIPLRIIRFSLFLIVLTGCVFGNQPVGQNRAEKPIPTTIQIANPPTRAERSTTMPVKIYLIALEDGGKSGTLIGCDDSLVAVETQIKNSQEALQVLLDNHDQWYGQSGLYNALYQSDLIVSRWQTTGDVLEIDLTGSLRLGGVCDNPRIKAQLEATIRQSPQENLPVKIRINGVPLEDMLSEK